MDIKKSAAAPLPCPICQRPMTAEFRPFCSKRCQQVDLGKWLKGRYRIPTNEAPTDQPVPGATHDTENGEGGNA
jgi:uncharacterized protein